MPKKTKITIAASALRDLEETRRWYEDRQVPDVGERFLVEVVSVVERLAEFPESGRIVPELGSANLREVIHGPFRIVYRIDKGRVRIVRVWRAERLFMLP